MNILKGFLSALAVGSVCLSFPAETRGEATAATPDRLVAPSPADTLGHELQEVTVGGMRTAPASTTPGMSMRFSIPQLMESHRVMGEADIVAYARQQAGVSTAGDYGSGVMVDGAEPSHTMYRIARVPVFFPFRFGGIFSTFNTPHFSHATFTRSHLGAATPNRLGARFDFDTSGSIPDSLHATLDVGLLASSVTLRSPVGRRVAVALSGRISYVDQLYGSLLRHKYSTTRYHFSDLNLTVDYELDSSNRLDLNLFRSDDHLSLDDGNYACDMRMDWCNSLAALRWTRTGSVRMEHRLYYTATAPSLSVEMPQFKIRIPSGLSMAGVAGGLRFVRHSRPMSFSGGYELNFYRNELQTASAEGYGTGQRGAEPSPVMHPVEGRLYAEADWQPAARLTLKGGVSATVFHNTPLPSAGIGSYTAVTADPRLSATVDAGFADFSLFAGSYSQFLHQVGFSEAGNASDFWITACDVVPRQRSWSFEMSADGRIPGAFQGVSYSILAYYRPVFNQPEFDGQILDLLSPLYSPFNRMATGRGYNVGCNFSATLSASKGYATVTAGYGAARRRYPGDRRMLRGRTDPGITLTAEAGYRVGARWNFGATFRLASGRPYTPVTAIYLMAENLVSVYGEPNSARLPAYHRVDLSASYRFASRWLGRGLSHCVNLSLINAYGQKNIEMQRVSFDLDSYSYRQKNVYSMYRFLPSLSYTLQF